MSVQVVTEAQTGLIVEDILPWFRRNESRNQNSSCIVVRFCLFCSEINKANSWRDDTTIAGMYNGQLNIWEGFIEITFDFGFFSVSSFVDT